MIFCSIYFPNKAVTKKFKQNCIHSLYYSFHNLYTEAYSFNNL